MSERGAKASLDCPKCGTARIDPGLLGNCPRCMLEEGLKSVPSPREEVQRVFAVWLEAEQAGRHQDFSVFCSHYAEMRPELEALHEAYRLGHGLLLSSSFQESIRQRFGDADRLRFSLQAISPREEGEGTGRKPSSDVNIGWTSGSARYVYEGELARGGMGIVYTVRDRDLNRRIAMKVIGEGPSSEGRGSAEGASSRWLAKFLEEAQITAQLDHPGIVSVHEVGLDEQGRLYFTMKLVKGRDLSEVANLARTGREGWNLPRLIGVLIRVCQAVAFAHNKGVIHRDLKPANIMVGKFGEVYVMDWGLAKVRGRSDLHQRQLQPRPIDEVPGLVQTRQISAGELTAQGTSSSDGMVVGTPAYMSPEQAHGQVARLDERSDIYSLGAILYRLLTGEAPYAGSEERGGGLEVVARLRQGPPAPVLSRNQGAPPELAAICAKAMAWDQSRRYDSCQALAEDLQAWLDCRVVQAYKTGPVAELHYWLARNKLVAVGSGTTLIVLLLAALVIIFYQQHTNQEYSRRFYTSLIGVVAVALNSGKHERAESLLQGCPMELRGWEWNYLHQEAQGWTAALLAEGPAPVLDVAAAPNGRWLAVARAEHPPQLVDRTEWVEWRVLDQPEATCLAWHPQSHLLAAAEPGGRICLWQPETGALLRTFDHPGEVSALAFSPQGLWLASAGREAVIRLWPLQGEESPTELRGHTDSVRTLDFSADGRWLVSGGQDKTVRTWDVATGQPLEVLIGHEGIINGVAFNADASRVVSVSSLAANIGGEIKLWDLSHRWARDLNLGEAGDGIVMARFSGDGTQIITCEYSGRLRFWDSRTGRAVGHLDMEGANSYNASFLVDGARLITWSRNGLIHGWQPKRPSTLQIPSKRGQLRSAVFDPLDRWLASASLGGPVHFLDLKSGALLRVAGSDYDNAMAMVLARDGSTLYSAHQWVAVQAWDPRTEQCRWRVDRPGLEFWCLALSPDQQILLTGSTQGSLHLWDALTGLELACHERVHLAEVEGVAFSPQQPWAASCGNDGRVILWETDSWARRWMVTSEVSHRTIVFSPDSRLLAFGNKDGTAEILQAASGRRLFLLTGHEQGVMSLQFSPNGRRLFTGSADGTVKVWNVATGDELLTLHASGASTVWDVALSGDGSMVAASDGWGALTIWRARPEP